MPSIPILLLCLTVISFRTMCDPLSPKPVSDSSNARLRNVRVVFLMATDCPISRQYVPVIRDFRDTWHAKGLGKTSLVFCNGPKQGHRGVVSDFLKEFGLDLPWRTDRGNRYARRMGTRVVPEVLVFRSGHLLYIGAIDDMFAGLGLRRPVTSEHYLADALEAIRNGRIPEPARRPAFGCLIE
jgi:hypothetical protein